MNIMQMMQQAQRMQKRLKETQEELKKMEMTGKSAQDLVEVLTDGHLKIQKVKIKKEAIGENIDDETIETLEDLVLEAIQNAQNDASKIIEEKMKMVTGGVSIPGLF